MKQTLGTVARGDRFFPRQRIISQIVKALQGNANIYLSGPRRVGKSSILYHLHEMESKEFEFIYVITESIDSENQFYKTIFEELLKSDAVKGFLRVSEWAKEKFRTLLEWVDEIGVFKIKDPGNDSYLESLVDLLKKLHLEGRQIVIMVDEFTQTLENIMYTLTIEDATHFAQQNRAMRHIPEIQSKVKFIYTGSISLFPIVEKIMGSLTAINDLKTIEVGALSETEAKDLINRLLSNHSRLINEETTQYMVLKIKWLIPFHIQLIVDECIDLSNHGDEINSEAIDLAFIQLMEIKNKPQFEPYFSRLKIIYKGKTYDFIMDILCHTAKVDLITSDEIRNYAVKNELNDYRIIVETLQFDGYLIVENDIYRFHSPILQMWVKQHKI